jgi:hypothetical protein
MTIPRKALTALALIASMSCVQAHEMSLLGKWGFAEANPAPWANEQQQKAALAYAKRFLNAEITFAPNEIVSKEKTFACKRAHYEPSDFPIDALFQGNLPEPNQERLALNMGFARGDVPGMEVRCTSGLYSYHFRDRGTVLFAYDNVIYTLKRR